MTVAFERTLRALQADRSRAATIGLTLTAVLLCGWATWLALGQVTVYEVSDRATLEAPTAAHPVASRVEGRVVSAHLELGRQVAANEVLVELDAEPERLTLREAQAQLAGLRAQAEAIESEMRADRNGLEAYRKSSGVAIDQARAREAMIARLNNDIEQRRIYAPVAGRLGRVEPLRTGAVVRSGDVLASIVPEGATRAVAFFPIASVGRLRAGQPARLRLDGFPWTQYGTLPAKVASVGNEAIDGHVRAELEVEPTSAKAIPIEHGLSGIAEVAVENTSPLDLMLRAIGRWLTTRQSGA